MTKYRLFTALMLVALVGFAAPQAARASIDDSVNSAAPDEGAPAEPPKLRDLENIRKVNIGDTKTGLPFNIRADAMKQAALSYGARGGLAWRTFHIRNELEGRAAYLDKIFDFRGLLIAAPSGLLIEPPVISEEVKPTVIDGTGQQAAVADRLYDISVAARIVETARSWRNYLERDWGGVSDPPDVLRPNDAHEREMWIKWVREGWDRGVEQANSIFQDDLNELSADYQGMVRYRTLLAQGMVTPPYALQTDRGVTGGGKKMRVGDRAVQITGAPGLVSGSEAWQPASR